MNNKIQQMILKVTSECNLSCKYCYVFNKQDKSYLHEPNIIKETTIIALLRNIDEYCRQKQIKQFHITFHGGEPLLAGMDFYKNFIALSEELIKFSHLILSIQTNGILLSSEWCTFFKENNIKVGLSIDGDRDANRNRIFKNGQEAFDDILNGFILANKYITIAILSVINTQVSPQRYYKFLKKIGVKYLDCLLPDATHDTINKQSMGIGFWLCQLFSIWFHDEEEQKPVIRMFEDICNLILGKYDHCGEMFGSGYNGVIDVRTDGTIDIPDTLRICNRPLLMKTYNINNNALIEIESEKIFKTFYNSHQSEYLSEKCNKCLIKSICGGGILAHRYSNENKFNNPTVYCNDIFMLITHIQNKMLDDIDQSFIVKSGIEKLSILDYTAW